MSQALCLPQKVESVFVFGPKIDTQISNPRTKEKLSVFDTWEWKRLLSLKLKTIPTLFRRLYQKLKNTSGKRPKRMVMGNRPPDPLFAPHEKLFRRYLPTHYDGRALTGMAFSLSDSISVNRSKYSVAEDVLFDEANSFSQYGVLSFRVQDIPPSLPREQPTCGFILRHTPMRINYAHSDIICNDLVNLEIHVQPNKRMRKLLQTELS